MHCAQLQNIIYCFQLLRVKLYGGFMESFLEVLSCIDGSQFILTVKVIIQLTSM